MKESSFYGAIFPQFTALETRIFDLATKKAAVCNFSGKIQASIILTYHLKLLLKLT